MVNVAVTSGMWKDEHEEICDEDDIQHIRNLRKEFKNMNRLQVFKEPTRFVDKANLF